jgi:hypothetical protein
MATRNPTPAIEIIGFEGGRRGRCFVVQTDQVDEGPVLLLSPAELLAHPQFDTLPEDDRERVRWLAGRAA